MPAPPELRLEEALDFAVLNGLLKRTPDGGLIHAPFTLAPCPIDPETNRRLKELSPVFNRLAFSVSRDLDFLAQALEEVVAADPFSADLLNLVRPAPSRNPLVLQITRSDYFLQAAAGDALPDIRQVELNTISASYAGSAGRVSGLHRHLLRETPHTEALIPNDPIPLLVEGFREAFALYGQPRACVLMVVQAGEGNVFDQRMFEFALVELGIPLRRATLEEIAADGSLREGHLVLRGEIAAITYFRAGYTPDDHRTPEALRAREMIENSSTISVPGVATQLAGTKKVQQVLSDAAVLKNFLPEDDATAVRATFAKMHTLEEPLDSPQGPRPAWQAAQASPGQFVLKPQREGGGNNLYDEELVRALESSSAEERRAFILMERIAPIPHRSVMVAEGRAKDEPGLSEIGRFGVLVADGERILMNRDAGYLVRTKGHQVREGGVSAGFGHLDSLIARPPEEAYRPIGG